MKRILIATVLAVGLASAGFVYAHGGGYGMMDGGYDMMGDGHVMMGDGHGMMGDGRGNNSWSNEERQKFLNDTAELRREMNNKRFDYNEARRNPKTTRQQLSKMEKEMIDLRDKIYDKAPQSHSAEQNQPAEQKK